MRSNPSILMVGSGSIAGKHSKHLHNMGITVKNFSEYCLKDQNLTSKLETFESIISNFDGIIIANSSNEHFDFAKIALLMNKKIYLEKPPCLSISEISSLLNTNPEIAEITPVGFQLRFSEAINLLHKEIERKLSQGNSIVFYNIIVGQNLKYWRQDGIRKGAYYLDHNTGGGVLFELSHEIDLLNWLFGMPKNIYGVGRNLLHKGYNILDFVTFVAEHQDCIGKMHLDMISPIYNRKVEVVFEDLILEWNISNDSFSILSDSDINIVYSNPLFKRGDYLENSMDSFINWLSSDSAWKGATLKESYNTLKLIEDMNFGKYPFFDMC